MERSGHYWKEESAVGGRWRPELTLIRSTFVAAGGGVGGWPAVALWSPVQRSRRTLLARAARAARRSARERERERPAGLASIPVLAKPISKQHNDLLIVD